MNIAHILKQQAQKQGSKIAIIDSKGGKTRQTSFAELNQQAAQIAQLLHKHGLKQGDAVLIFQTMSAELYAILTAIFRLGLIAVFIDPSAERGHLQRCCKLYPPQALIASSKAHLLRLISKELRQIPLKFFLGFWVPATFSLESYHSLAALEEITNCSAETPALITFTSGSTGEPKAALRSHAFLIAQHRALERSLGLTAAELDLSTLPIFVLANLASGLSSFIPPVDLRKPGSIKAAPVIREIAKQQVSRISASPAFILRLCDHADLSKTELRSVTKVFSGGAPVFPNALSRFQRLAPQATITAVYGSTEAEPIAHLSLQDISVEDHQAMRSGKGLLAGSISSDLNLAIVRNQWGKPLGKLSETAFLALHCAPYQAGEIVVAGEHVLAGYLDGKGDEESKFDVLHRRWHRTGDLGYLDSQGRLWLLGRCSALVEDSKGRLYPFAVECAAHYHEGIKRCAAISHKAKRLLILEPHQGKKLDISHIKHSLAWAELDSILLMSLPVDKRHNAKIDYPRLRKQLAKLLAL